MRSTGWPVSSAISPSTVSRMCRRSSACTSTSTAEPPIPAEPWCIRIRACGRARRLPFVPAESRNCPALHARPEGERGDVVRDQPHHVADREHRRAPTRRASGSTGRYRMPRPRRPARAAASRSGCRCRRRAARRARARAGGTARGAPRRRTGGSFLRLPCPQRARRRGCGIPFRRRRIRPQRPCLPRSRSRQVLVLAARHARRAGRPSTGREPPRRCPRRGSAGGAARRPREHVFDGQRQRGHRVVGVHRRERRRPPRRSASPAARRRVSTSIERGGERVDVSVGHQHPAALCEQVARAVPHVVGDDRAAVHQSLGDREPLTLERGRREEHGCRIELVSGIVRQPAQHDMRPSPSSSMSCCRRSRSGPSPNTSSVASGTDSHHHRERPDRVIDALAGGEPVQHDDPAAGAIGERRDGCRRPHRIRNHHVHGREPEAVLDVGALRGGRPQHRVESLGELNHRDHSGFSGASGVNGGSRWIVWIAWTSRRAGSSHPASSSPSWRDSHTTTTGRSDPPRAVRPRRAPAMPGTARRTLYDAGHRPASS